MSLTTEQIATCERAAVKARQRVWDFYANSVAHQKGFLSSDAANFEAQNAYENAFYQLECQLLNLEAKASHLEEYY